MSLSLGNLSKQVLPLIVKLDKLLTSLNLNVLKMFFGVSALTTGSLEALLYIWETSPCFPVVTQLKII